MILLLRNNCSLKVRDNCIISFYSKTFITRRYTELRYDLKFLMYWHIFTFEVLNFAALGFLSNKTILMADIAFLCGYFIFFKAIQTFLAKYVSHVLPYPWVKYHPYIPRGLLLYKIVWLLSYTQENIESRSFTFALLPILKFSPRTSS